MPRLTAAADQRSRTRPGVGEQPSGGSYEQIRDFHVGVPALGLDLSVGHWTAEGLLAVFFLVAGIELKRELVVGELRAPAMAALPVVNSASVSPISSMPRSRNAARRVGFAVQISLRTGIPTRLMETAARPVATS